jgi:hypothetical protein
MQTTCSTRRLINIYLNWGSNDQQIVEISAGGPQLGGKCRGEGRDALGLASKNGTYNKRIATNAGKVTGGKSATLCVTTLHIAQS